MYQLRRGLGAESTDTSGAPCPGSPGCPGYVAPGSMDYQTSLLQEVLANQYGTPVPGAVAAPGTFTSWMNTNATLIGVGVAAVLALALFSKVGR